MEGDEEGCWGCEGGTWYFYSPLAHYCTIHRCKMQRKVRPHHPQQTNVTHEWHRWELVARKVSTSHDVYVTCEVNVSESPEVRADRNSRVAQPLRAIEGLFINQVTQIPYTYRTVCAGRCYVWHICMCSDRISRLSAKYTAEILSIISRRTESNK